MRDLGMVLSPITQLLIRRNIIWELVRSDFRGKYLGSSLGMLWAFLHPAIYTVILWFVFQIGFHSRSQGDVPFILWMLSGMVPWFFFSEALASATDSVLGNSFLVKKMMFNVSILPVIRILSSLVVHLFLVILLVLISSLYGHLPGLYQLQFFYYLFAGTCLLLGMSLLTSALVVLLRDLKQVVNVALQFLFWLTPVVWSSAEVPPQFTMLLKLNPVFYLVQGYRDTFLYRVWFWEGHPLWTLYFWGVSVLMMVAGVLVFRHLRPKFADLI